MEESAGALDGLDGDEDGSRANEAVGHPLAHVGHPVQGCHNLWQLLVRQDERPTVLGRLCHGKTTDHKPDSPDSPKELCKIAAVVANAHTTFLNAIQTKVLDIPGLSLALACSKFCLAWLQIKKMSQARPYHLHLCFPHLSDNFHRPQFAAHIIWAGYN